MRHQLWRCAPCLAYSSLCLIAIYTLKTRQSEFYRASTSNRPAEAICRRPRLLKMRPAAMVCRPNTPSISPMSPAFRRRRCNSAISSGKIGRSDCGQSCLNGAAPKALAQMADRQHKPGRIIAQLAEVRQHKYRPAQSGRRENRHLGQIIVDFAVYGGNALIAPIGRSLVFLMRASAKLKSPAR